MRFTYFSSISNFYLLFIVYFVDIMFTKGSLLIRAQAQSNGKVFVKVIVLVVEIVFTVVDYQCEVSFSLSCYYNYVID